MNLYLTIHGVQGDKMDAVTDALCKIIPKLKGEDWCESANDDGTTFDVEVGVDVSLSVSGKEITDLLFEAARKANGVPFGFFQVRATDLEQCPYEDYEREG
jgi:hypothetical protein